VIEKLDLISKAGDLPGLRAALVPEPQPLSGRETIQLILVREVQDYTILRTEETRELNTVWTPGKAGSDTVSDRQVASEPVERVAFLATKQKAAESRELEGLLRTWNSVAGRGSVDECYLKSALCLACPRCVLFGATDVSKRREKGANIKHRIAYATAFSLLPVDPDLRETHTFNGVDEATQLTGQTLGDRESVRPCSVFGSIVTLRAVTEAELVLALKTILSCTRYGAETRIGGFVRNHIVGLVAAQEEILSPLELTLALSDGDGDATDASRVHTVLEDYRKRCSTPDAAQVLGVEDLTRFLEATQAVVFDKKRLDTVYDTADKFRGKQKTYMKKAKG
jgi:CRISPR type I-D-associated protein Csc2